MESFKARRESETIDRRSILESKYQESTRVADEDITKCKQMCGDFYQLCLEFEKGIDLSFALNNYECDDKSWYMAEVNQDGEKIKDLLSNADLNTMPCESVDENDTNNSEDLPIRPQAINSHTNQTVDSCSFNGTPLYDADVSKNLDQQSSFSSIADSNADDTLYPQSITDYDSIISNAELSKSTTPSCKPSSSSLLVESLKNQMRKSLNGCIKVEFENLGVENNKEVKLFQSYSDVSCSDFEELSRDPVSSSIPSISYLVASDDSFEASEHPNGREDALEHESNAETEIEARKIHTERVVDYSVGQISLMENSLQDCKKLEEVSVSGTESDYVEVEEEPTEAEVAVKECAADNSEEGSQSKKAYSGIALEDYVIIDSDGENQVVEIKEQSSEPEVTTENKKHGDRKSFQTRRDNNEMFFEVGNGAIGDDDDEKVVKRRRKKRKGPPLNMPRRKYKPHDLKSFSDVLKHNQSVVKKQQIGSSSFFQSFRQQPQSTSIRRYRDSVARDLLQGVTQVKQIDTKTFSARTRSPLFEEEQKMQTVTPSENGFIIMERCVSTPEKGFDSMIATVPSLKKKGASIDAGNGIKLRAEISGRKAKNGMSHLHETYNGESNVPQGRKLRGRKAGTELSANELDGANSEGISPKKPTSSRTRSRNKKINKCVGSVKNVLNNVKGEEENEISDIATNKTSKRSRKGVKRINMKRPRKRSTKALSCTGLGSFSNGHSNITMANEKKEDSSKRKMNTKGNKSAKQNNNKERVNGGRVQENSCKVGPQLSTELDDGKEINDVLTGESRSKKIRTCVDGRKNVKPVESKEISDAVSRKTSNKPRKGSKTRGNKSTKESHNKQVSDDKKENSCKVEPQPTTELDDGKEVDDMLTGESKSRKIKIVKNGQNNVKPAESKEISGVASRKTSNKPRKGIKRINMRGPRKANKERKEIANDITTMANQKREGRSKRMKTEGNKLAREANKEQINDDNMQKNSCELSARIDDTLTKESKDMGDDNMVVANKKKEERSKRKMKTRGNKSKNESNEKEEDNDKKENSCKDKLQPSGGTVDSLPKENKDISNDNIIMANQQSEKRSKRKMKTRGNKSKNESNEKEEVDDVKIQSNSPKDKSQSSVGTDDSLPKENKGISNEITMANQQREERSKRTITRGNKSTNESNEKEDVNDEKIQKNSRKDKSQSSAELNARKKINDMLRRENNDSDEIEKSNNVKAQPEKVIVNESLRRSTRKVEQVKRFELNKENSIAETSTKRKASRKKESLTSNAGYKNLDESKIPPKKRRTLFNNKKNNSLTTIGFSILEDTTMMNTTANRTANPNGNTSFVPEALQNFLRSFVGPKMVKKKFTS
eukprot:gene9721-10712_t